MKLKTMCSEGFYLEYKPKRKAISLRYCCKACSNEYLDLEIYLKNPINSLKNFINKHGYINQLFSGKCNITNKELCNKEVDLTKCNSITLGFPMSCNFKCKYCPKIDRLNDIKLDNELLFTTLKTIEYFPNITDLKLSDNGEITLIDYNKFIDNFPKNIKSLVIFTNGSNKDWITKINNFCIEKNITLTVLVSLHTLNKDEFIKITSIDYFEKVVNNILYWKSLNINLVICHVIFDKSISKTETFLNWSTKVGIKTILVPNIYDTNIDLNIFKEKYDIII